MVEEKKSAKKSKKEESKKEKKISSAKGFYHYIKQAWKKPSEDFDAEIRKRMITWRAGKRIEKLEKPSRLDKARQLGYKAKKGFVVFRVTLERGGRQKERPRTKRRSKRLVAKKVLKMNYQWVAEQRVQHAYPNLEVLNSYLLGKDGTHYFFEVIAVDTSKPEIKSDKDINWICLPKNRNRALRGLTSAARKSRGLRKKTRNIKVRPSIRAWQRRGK